MAKHQYAVVVNESTSSTHVVTACNTYTWIDGNTYTSNNNTATHTLTNAVGCDSIVTLDLTINTVSNVTVTTSGLTITASNASATYQWLDCSNSFAVIASQTGSSFTATANGSYAVELTENGCKDTSACVNITTVGFEDLSTDNEITVYPNPTQGKVNLVLGQQMNNATVIVRNALGQEIFRSSYATVNNIELNIEGENGIYFVEIFSEGEKAMVKVVKH
jgi:hypothetical protein